MNHASILATIAALCAFALAVMCLVTWRRTFAGRVAAVALLILSIERFASAVSLTALSTDSIRQWQEWRLVTVGALAVGWLVFALTYARGNPRSFLIRWRWAIAAVSLVPIVVSTRLLGRLVPHVELTADGWVASVNVAGVALHVSALLTFVLALMSLERTFRASVGAIRWRIKFVILGAGVFLVVRLYTSTQAVLFRGFGPALETIDSLGSLVALTVMARGVFRAPEFSPGLYPSLSILQGSLTATLAGVYLLSLGVFAKIAAHFGGDTWFALKAFVLLVSLVALAVLLQSDRLRLRLRRFLSRNFQRPIYDYRAIWRKFTDGTATCIEQGDLCRSVVRITADIFQSLGVSMWLVNESRGTFTLAASTSSGASVNQFTPEAADVREVIRYFEKHPEAVDIEHVSEWWAEVLRRCQPREFLTGGDRVSVPLVRRGQVIGVIIMGDRVSGAAYPIQDFDLLKCIADQATASLLNLQLSQRLVQAKELEAFQNMAAFFVHDLKNAASMLSVMLRNLPVHYENPEFRADALRGIGKTVTHINSVVSRLTALRHELTLNRAECDLNKIVRNVLATIEKDARANVSKEMHDLPAISADEEQIRKVATNLVLNAMEAVDGHGTIHVTTAFQADSVVLTVADTGCGMSREFVDRSLFRPFQTTKKNGLGIGMFQSRMIVEAHGGRINVNSEPGKGTVFEVHLPTRGN